MSSTDGTNRSPQQTPRVSIVMGVYNEGVRVHRALESLQAQTFDDFELIVVDDGSTDNTVQILDQYRQQDPRIVVIRQTNLGLTMALINGCNLSRGQYIARHDADDWSDPKRLERQIKLLDADPDVGMVGCTTQYVGPNDEPLELVVRTGSPVEATRKLLDERQGPAAHGSMMFRRTLYEDVGGYRSEFYFAQDSDLWLRMGERAQIAYDATLLYFARRDPFGLSGRMGAGQHEFGRWGQECRAARREGQSEEPILESARKLADELRTRKTVGSTSWGLAKMSHLIGSMLARKGDPRAKSYFWQAVQANPLYWRAWLRILLPRTPR
jgi:glycosyltransferase involved in cell wall biosynthesis